MAITTNRFDMEPTESSRNLKLVGWVLVGGAIAGALGTLLALWWLIAG